MGGGEACRPRGNMSRVESREQLFMSPAGWPECDSTSLLGPVYIWPQNSPSERQSWRETEWDTNVVEEGIMWMEV